MSSAKFATLINCMDGRIQMPVWRFVKNVFRVDFVDVITDPGPVKILGDPKDNLDAHYIKRRVQVSANAHGSRQIAVVAHHDCTGNPVNKEVQLKQLSHALQIVKSWNFGFTEITGIWVDERWQVHEVMRG